MIRGWMASRLHINYLYPVPVCCSDHYSSLSLRQVDWNPYTLEGPMAESLIMRPSVQLLDIVLTYSERQLKVHFHIAHSYVRRLMCLDLMPRRRRRSLRTLAAEVHDRVPPCVPIASKFRCFYDGYPHVIAVLFCVAHPLFLRSAFCSLTAAIAM